MSRFRKKPVVIDAMRWDGENQGAIVQWAQGGWGEPYARQKDLIWLKQKTLKEDPLRYVWYLVIPTIEGDMEAAPGDWIIRGVKGEIYPCKPDIFELTYEKVDEGAGNDQ